MELFADILFLSIFVASFLFRNDGGIPLLVQVSCDEERTCWKRIPLWDYLIGDGTPDPLYNIGVKAKLAESSVSLAMGKSRIRLMFCQCQWWEVQKTPGNFTRYFWREGGRLLPSPSWNLLQSEEKNEQENKIDTRARLGLSEEETESLNAALHICIFFMKISQIYFIWKHND